jgi:CRISPR-associated RAMP protein (TIGR02581 family)
MLKTLINELRCDLAITTVGPVLVKSGHASVSGPDMTPVRTYRNGEWQVYLPGSSLKGVVRSHLEKICRTLNPQVVCDPFTRTADVCEVRGGRLTCPQFPEVACGDKFELREKGELRVEDRTWHRAKSKVSSAAAYRDSCPACRLFGSTSFIGRLSITDAYLTDAGPGRTETRDGVGIDRLTGGAAHGAKFELETVSSGVSFETQILLRNFECWQLGMLLVAIADLHDGLVHVGSGRSRGLGAVTGDVRELSIHTLHPSPTRQPSELWGLGRFHSAEQRTDYGTFEDDILELDALPDESRSGLRQVSRFSGSSLRSLANSARQELVTRLDHWPDRGEMQWSDDWQSRGAHG